jgi:hypothetical protein
MRQLLAALSFLTFLSSGAQVKIGGDPESVSPHTLLELESSTQGFLPPRLSTVQRDALASPPVGLMILNTDNNCMEYYRPTGWYSLCPKVPSVTTSSVVSVTAVSASGGGSVSDDGGDAVTARGVCWSTSPSPDLGDSFTADGPGIGPYTSSITGLEEGTLYYVRAYATNDVGTAYGNEVSFTTLARPSVTTAAASLIFGRNASGGGTVTGDGGAPVTDRGICWSSSPAPEISDSFASAGSGAGAYSEVMSGLDYSTTYYVRAYAQNSVGIAYGNEVSFTTNTGTLVSFTATGAHTWNVPSGVKSADVLVVGGGGGGAIQHTGGGGGGGVVYQTNVALSTPTVSVTVGGGGVNNANLCHDCGYAGTTGSNSVFGSIIAYGGGGGRGWSETNSGNGLNGGSGGGGGVGRNSSGTGGTGVAGQGYAGGNGFPHGAGGIPYRGTGGGGAGGLGGNMGAANAGHGGIGVLNSITGTPTYYGGGGGGGVYGSGGQAGNGGQGGGGAGGAAAGGTNAAIGATGNATGAHGQPNTGGGGGASGQWEVAAGNGGSGVVHIRY